MTSPLELFSRSNTSLRQVEGIAGKSETLTSRGPAPKSGDHGLCQRKREEPP